MDKVVITAKVRNYMSDSIVHQSTMTTYYDNLKNEFKCQGDCTGPSVGPYYVDVTYKCYKNGTLLETITGQTESVYI